jgi:hypothetical protein
VSVTWLIQGDQGNGRSIACEEALTKACGMVEVLVMRTLIALIAASVVSVATVQAQDAGSQAGMDVNATKKGAELLMTPPARPTGPLRLEQGTVTYGGFLVDLAKSPSPSRTMSLRQPVRHDAESPNVFRDSVSGRARGFVLFAIRF